MTTPQPPSPDLFEKLATFYLGRHVDIATGKTLDCDLLLVDAKDFCTHAMCVGMTGSGKTGLCLAMLEEAAMDGIPAICIDPKGDLANLMLAFPELRTEDFRPWLEEGEARRKGMDLDQFAETTAKTWREGLAAWGQTPDRVQRFKESADVAVYTPGSTIGLPLTVLQSFDAPPEAIRDDPEAMRERIAGAASGLLTLLSIDSDPLLSREHILISSILDHAWGQGRDVSIGDLIGMIASPPISRVGVLDLDTFMPPSDRGKLAMMLNNLLASPAFGAWLEGEPLSIERLLHTVDGKPRLSILSIAHLNDQQRMFFVTILLNELVAWMRTQSGTSSLRAILYMDEVAGYFPPVANPPSKPPMLTLLKQARAFGLGVTLATQNPVDLDYKGLANIGIWFLGRLQTDRDKARVLDGLEGAAMQSGQRFDKAEMERLLASLKSRVFLMNNVHDDHPSLFQSRWALSFLAGPLARDQISRLMAPRKEAALARSVTSANDSVAAAKAPSSRSTARERAAPSRPVTPIGITEAFLTPTRYISGDGELRYRPMLLGVASMHFVRVGAGIDQWSDRRRVLSCDSGVPEELWEASEPLRPGAEWTNDFDAEFAFEDLPDELRSATKVKVIHRQFKDYLYRHHAMELFRSPMLDQIAPPGSSQTQARSHFRIAARERLDVDTAKLREKYDAKIRALESKVRTADERVAREANQYEAEKMSSLVSLGASVVGAFMGRKVVSRTNVSKITTAARGATRTAQQLDDVERARKARNALELDLRELEADLRRDVRQLGERYDVDQLTLETITIPPRKSDMVLGEPTILWTPWLHIPAGETTPLW